MKSLLLFLSFFWQPQLEAPKFNINDSYVFAQQEFFYVATPFVLYKTIDGIIWESKSIVLPETRLAQESVVIGGENYFVSAGLGEVYVFREDQFLRIDQSFDFRNFYGASLFLWDEKMHSFGGYGLFTTKNDILYFDSQALEWFKTFTNQEVGPSPRANALHFFKDNQFFVGLGGALVAAESSEFFNDFWQLNLETNKWSFLGTASNEINYLELIKSKDRITRVYNYKYPLWLSSSKLMGFDFINNRLYNYPNVSLSFLQDINGLYYNPKTDLFLLTQLDNENDFKYRPKVLPASAFLGSPKFLDLLYTPPYRFEFLHLFLLVFFVFIFGGIWFVYVRRKKIVVNELNTKVLKGQLPKAEYDILEIILRNHPAPTAFPEILNYFEPKLTYESRIKKLRVSIDHLNQSLKDIYGGDKEYIVSQKNKDDRRIKEVYFNE